jgi:F-type H+-transporting ATPase subunit epsilon
MATMRVDLVAPDRPVWSGTAEAVYARTTDGELGVLAGHVPLLGELAPGPVRILREGDDELAAAVHGGFLSVTAERVSILAERVELAEEIDVARARRDVERAHESGADEDTIARARRAEARLQVVGETV